MNPKRFRMTPKRRELTEKMLPHLKPIPIPKDILDPPGGGDSSGAPVSGPYRVREEYIYSEIVYYDAEGTELRRFRLDNDRLHSVGEREAPGEGEMEIVMRLKP